MNYKDYIRIIPDFPQPGIRFKDITTLTNNGAVYASAIQEIKQAIADKQIDLIAGPEARGFIIGAPLAISLGVGFVPIRKSGKLPGEVVEANYDLEYGKDKLCIHKDAIQPGQKVLIADDLLATGGTIATTINLIRQLGGEVIGSAFLIELGYLDGRSKLDGIDVFSLVTY
ncbi:adenine phosphoribosyltransferase [Paenibacillus sp. R14(2021)]|uniref:adenine phosphoribosyltransferase n=1 Tax=Paenibacillus sp. R14(2021) TaxID=2859228 RepID=UPI001C613076|nr:adenine phosphoribosyltransferase [Paenibacillus sp. R14(2021)]